MTRACFVPALSGFLVLTTAGLWDLTGFPFFTRGPDKRRLFEALDIGTSPVERHRAAPPQPHQGQPPAGRGNLALVTYEDVPAVPLQTGTNASHFWIILLLSWLTVIEVFVAGSENNLPKMLDKPVH
jgi:hypothetical protein